MKPLMPPQVDGMRTILQDFARYQSAAFRSRSASFFALELCGECGELANLEKKIWRDCNQAPSCERLAEEAADVGIALMNYCNARGIDLQAAMEAKLHEIEARRLAGKMGLVTEEIS